MEPTDSAPKPTPTKVNHAKPLVCNNLDPTHWNAFGRVMYKSTLPCATGTFDLDPGEPILFYGKNGPNEVSRRVDFSNPSEEDLRLLAESCDAATFGVNSESVFDESYRKAGKLDAASFASTFDPESVGLMEIIRAMLLEGYAPDTPLWVERYKLNVYGPGSFFKAHQDTPRDPLMFASLVVVFPTPHSGGALLFRHDDKEYTFDSAQGVAESTPSSPQVAFAAFFSDVLHEVTPVISGYRVTITYNIYMTHQPKHNLITKCSSVYSDAFHSAFKSLLDDHTTLPEGGLLAFSLKHEYPIKTTSDTRETFIPLNYLEASLKGSDAVLRKVCVDLGLDVQLNMVYYEKHCRFPVWILCPGYSTANFSHERGSMYDVLKKNGGKTITPTRDYYMEEYPPDVEVTWATRPLQPNVKRIESKYNAYGNEPSTGYTYSSIVLIVTIPAVGTDLRPAQEVQVAVEA